MNTSIGFDVLLNQSISNVRIQQAIASVFGVEQKRVSVISNIEDYPDRTLFEFVCLKTIVSRRFFTLLAVDGKSPQNESRDLVQWVSALSTELSLPILFEGTTDNPYQMRLVHQGNLRNVSLDTSAGGGYSLEDDTTG